LFLPEGTRTIKYKCPVDICSAGRAPPTPYKHLTIGEMFGTESLPASSRIQNSVGTPALFSKSYNIICTKEE